MNRNKLLMVLAAVALLAAGCKSTSTLPGGSASGGPQVVSSDNDGSASTRTTGIGNGSGLNAVPFADAAPADREILQNNLIVYFEFDSSEIQPQFNEMLAAHGRYLASHPEISIRLEGHTDERGTREYNIGLGERRAQAVRQILLLQGASASQLSTVSYGEERPVAFGNDEESYRLNRRVELVY